MTGMMKYDKLAWLLYDYKESTSKFIKPCLKQNISDEIKFSVGFKILDSQI